MGNPHQSAAATDPDHRRDHADCQHTCAWATPIPYLRARGQDSPDRVSRSRCPHALRHSARAQIFRLRCPHIPWHRTPAQSSCPQSPHDYAPAWSSRSQRPQRPAPLHPTQTAPSPTTCPSSPVVAGLARAIASPPRSSPAPLQEADSSASGKEGKYPTKKAARQALQALVNQEGGRTLTEGRSWVQDAQRCHAALQ